MGSYGILRGMGKAASNYGEMVEREGAMRGRLMEGIAQTRSAADLDISKRTAETEQSIAASSLNYAIMDEKAREDRRRHLETLGIEQKKVGIMEGQLKVAEGEAESQADYRKRQGALAGTETVSNLGKWNPKTGTWSPLTKEQIAAEQENGTFQAKVDSGMYIADPRVKGTGGDGSGRTPDDIQKAEAFANSALKRVLFKVKGKVPPAEQAEIYNYYFSSYLGAGGGQVLKVDDKLADTWNAMDVKERGEKYGGSFSNFVATLGGVEQPEVKAEGLTGKNAAEANAAAIQAATDLVSAIPVGSEEKELNRLLSDPKYTTEQKRVFREKLDKVMGPKYSLTPAAKEVVSGVSGVAKGAMSTDVPYGMNPLSDIYKGAKGILGSVIQKNR